MGHKLQHFSIGLISAGVVGLIFSVIMEIATGEPVYYLVMKITAGLFGVGGPLLGLAIVRGAKRKSHK